MCGASSQQQQLASEETSFQTQLMANYAERFGAQSDIFQNLTSVFSPLAEAGPNQAGFSPQELATLNTNAINSTGANYANAAKALNTQQAGRTDNSGLETGVQQQQKEALASAAAGQLSNEQLGITQANYEQGRQNWLTGMEGLGGIANGEAPTSFAGQATSANASAYKEAQQNATQGWQEGVDLLSGLSGGFTSGWSANRALNPPGSNAANSPS